MKHNLFLTMLAAALLGSGVAHAAGTLKASEYTSGSILLGTSPAQFGTLVVDTPLTLTTKRGYLDLYDGATIEFQKQQAAEAICSIFTSENLVEPYTPISFSSNGGSYNFAFNDGAQAIVAASAGTPITLIEDLKHDSPGFAFHGNTPTLQLNGVAPGGTVSMGGVEFTYVGPKGGDYTFQEGQIGFTGYYAGSHNLSLVAKAAPTPEPATGTLGLLALAALAARRRRK